MSIHQATTLKRLSPAVRGRLDDGFRRGDSLVLEAEDLIDDIDFGRTIELAALHTVIDEAMERFSDDEPERSDRWLAPRIHAALRLTRREAAFRDIWIFLNAVARPDYVRWRFTSRQQPTKGTVALDRFLGEDSKNALARLWWTAELTRNGNSYEWTDRAAGINRFYVSWLGLDVMHHRPAAVAIARYLATGNDGKPLFDTPGQRLAKRFNLRLSTLSIDTLVPNPPVDHLAIREWCEIPPDPTLFLDDLPDGPDEAAVPEEHVQRIVDLLAEVAGDCDTPDA